MTVIDFDDFGQNNNRLDLLWALKMLRPDFRMTAFAIPMNGTPEFWNSVPPWIELAVHGWHHPDPREAEHWTYADMDKRMAQVPQAFVKGFKAPGWQISDPTYEWLARHDWWVADQDYNDWRRPSGLACYKIAEGSWHGHIQNVCGNGLEETWGQVIEVVSKADEFLFASEALR